MKNQVDLIDAERQEMLYRSVNMSQTSSPKRDKFFESRKFTGIMASMESEAMRSISNAEEIYCGEEDDEDENF